MGEKSNLIEGVAAAIAVPTTTANWQQLRDLESYDQGDCLSNHSYVDATAYAWSWAAAMCGRLILRKDEMTFGAVRPSF